MAVQTVASVIASVERCTSQGPLRKITGELASDCASAAAVMQKKMEALEIRIPTSNQRFMDVSQCRADSSRADSCANVN
jgi:hypothetical protein